MGNKDISFHQLERSDQHVHFSYESKEENAENLEISETSLPLCFEACEIFKEKEEQLLEIYEVPFETICNKLQQSFQVLYDPIADRSDDESNHNFSPLIECEGQNQDDNGFTRQSLQSVEISSQRAIENVQGDKEKSDFSIPW